MESIALRPRPAAPQRLLRVPAAAERLDVSERTLWRWIHAGKFPHVRLGPTRTTIRIPVAALEAWIAEHTEGQG